VWCWASIKHAFSGQTTLAAVQRAGAFHGFFASRTRPAHCHSRQHHAQPKPSVSKADLSPQLWFGFFTVPSLRVIASVGLRPTATSALNRAHPHRNVGSRNSKTKTPPGVQHAAWHFFYSMFHVPFEGSGRGPLLSSTTGVPIFRFWV
jgi:hypothetical protein